jgi:Fur family transcriptional regulator, ferric uptake regulator
MSFEEQLRHYRNSSQMKTVALKRRSMLQELTLRGIRITGQRKILIETMQEAARHLDAATLLELARKRDGRINRATVYRTIELLKKQRLIDELDLMHLNGEKHFYEAKTNIDHMHLACFECGQIEEFTSPLFERLKAEISRQKKFRIQVTRLEIGGRCSRCCALATSRAECGEEACCKDGKSTC